MVMMMEEDNKTKQKKSDDHKRDNECTVFMS